MNNTIFDLLEDEIPSGKEGFFEVAKNAPQPKDNSFLNSVSDYAKTIAKGTAEGLGRLGRMMAPLQEIPKIENGRINIGKNTQQQLEEQTENLDKLLPTEEGYGQRGLRRGLREAPSMMSFGGNVMQALPRSIAAGFLGEGAKDLGLPEWAQTAAELTAFIGPDFTKKLLSEGKNKELIEFSKKMGLSDAEITPLIQSEFKQKWLSKLTQKRGSTEKYLENSKKAIDETYSTIQKSEAAGKEISEKVNGNLVNKIFEKLNDMPRDIRSKIEPDLQDLLNNKITGKSLINFYRDINSHHSGNTKQLSLLKEPIKEALSSLSPELSKDFELINSLYTKYFPIASKLKPNLMSDIVSAGKSLGLGVSTLGALTVGYYPPLVAFLGEMAAKKLAQQILLNPRFQQLSRQMVKAMNQNKFGVVKRLTKAMSNQIKKYSPEVSQELENISDEELREFLNSKIQEN